MNYSLVCTVRDCAVCKGIIRYHPVSSVPTRVKIKVVIFTTWYMGGPWTLGHDGVRALKSLHHRKTDGHHDPSFALSGVQQVQFLQTQSNHHQSMLSAMVIFNKGPGRCRPDEDSKAKKKSAHV